MTRKRADTPVAQLSHRWFIAEWAAFRGKTQADAQRDLDWPKATASDLWTGKQRYTQHRIDQASTWLDIEPFELLLPPKRALMLRRLHESAREILAQAAEEPAEFVPPPRKHGTAA